MPVEAPPPKASAPSSAPAWTQLVHALRHGRGSLARHLLRGAGGTAGLHLTATALTLITSVLVARMLGAEEFGIFVFATALMHLLAMPAVLGLDQLVIRQVAVYLGSGERAALAGLLRRSDHLALATSFALAAVAAVVAWLLWDGGPDRRMLVAVWLGLLAVPLLSLTRIRQAAIQGLHRVVQGQLAETVVWPVLFLALLVAYLGFAERGLTAQVAVGLQALGLAGTLLVAIAMLRAHLPLEVRQAQPEYRTRAWLASALPLAGVVGLQVINARTDTMMLAALDGPEAVGIYNVASRGAGFVWFFLVAGQRALAPTIATFHQQGDRRRLQEVVTTAARLMLLASLPIALAFVFAGEWIVTLVYGAEFAPAAGALAILSVAYLIGVALGPTVTLLMMTGQERAAVVAVGCSAVLNIVLNAILIPRFGVEGAAVATAVSLVGWTGGFAWVIRRRLGIRPSAFATGRRPLLERPS